MRLATRLPLLALLTSHGVFAAPTAHPAPVPVPVPEAEPAAEPTAEDPQVEERQLGFGNPEVTISTPKATIRGRSRPFINILTPGPMGALESFKAIPYAKPPVGPLRLKPPVPLDPAVDMGTIDATALAAPACPQQIKDANVDIPGLPSFLTTIVEGVFNSPLLDIDVLGGQEDCLTINVQRPGGVKEGDNLPVVLWIYGGGFELGSTAMYDGAHVVETGVELGKPVVFVAMNYRVAGFGFLGGKEILADGSANLGLLDQRLAMEWVADNIRSFGGDPDKVTLWGESAGAISIYAQMLAKDGDNSYKGKPLFRGAIMNSGSVTPTDPVDCPKAQVIYDQVVANAGCAGNADTLECLRGVNYDTFLNATNSVPYLLSYNALALSYLPRPDGTFLTASPEVLTAAGKYARVPYILGDQEDEGTLFGLFTSNISTTEQLSTYLKELYFTSPNANVEALVALYPEDPSVGSPFFTGTDYNFYPQFKRIAALLGDVVFTLTRRLVLTITSGISPDVPSWSYLSTYNRGTAYLGTFHGSDLIQVFYGVKDNYAASAIMLYFLNFAYNLDPNNGAGGAAPQPGLFGRPTPTVMDWPQWKANNTLVGFGADSFTYIQDDFRKEVSDFLLTDATNLRV